MNPKNPELLTEMTENLEQLKNNKRIINLFDATKIIKCKWQPKNLKHTLTSSIFGKHATHGVSKCKK